MDGMSAEDLEEAFGSVRFAGRNVFDRLKDNTGESKCMNNICQVLLYEYKAAKRKGRSYFTAAFSTASETASNISCGVYGVSSDRVIESGDCVS